jgi:signal recognition particle receptor subunit beta
MMINWHARELRLKIVYYGPALSGKTTNLEQIHAKINPENRSNLLSLKTNEERTLYFDFMQFELGKICGLTPNIQLYTVPGQDYYQASRRLVLRGADGVVFVADSDADRINDNIEAWKDMNTHLKQLCPQADKTPVIVQLNKRDLSNAISPEILKSNLDSFKGREFEAIAVKGIGVFDTLKAILNQVIIQVQTAI